MPLSRPCLNHSRLMSVMASLECLSVLRDHVLRPRLGAADEEIRIEVFALARQHAVIIECGRLVLEVPFADHGRLVSRLLHLRREILSLGGEVAVEIEHAVGLRILAGDDAGPAGCADGVVAVDPVETHPVLGQGVDVGRGIQPGQAAAVSADGLGGMIIGHDEQDIGPHRLTLVAASRCETGPLGLYHGRNGHTRLP